MGIQPVQLPKLKRFICQQWRTLLIAPAVSLIAIAVSTTGCLQGFEWAVLDAFFRWRPSESLDQRIVIITIDDQDITHAGQWPISDAILANLLVKLHAQKPRIIALDLYRDLPVRPGYEQLGRAFQSMPELIGVRKQFGDRQVPPPPALNAQKQVAAADLVVDQDGTIRRALLVGSDPQTQESWMGLGTKVALNYLAAENIHLEMTDAIAKEYRLGRALFRPFWGNDGGYVNADALGYQILLNYWGTQEQFRTVSMTQVLWGEVPNDLFRDRVVFIGSIAESTKDFFQTPYDNERQDQTLGMAGVIVHANITSEILSAALDGRPLIRVVPDAMEWGWLFLWSAIGVLVSWNALKTLWIGRQWLYGRAFLVNFLSGISLLGISYLCFLAGWWIPFALPLLGLILSALLYMSAHSHQMQQLAYFDALTQIANRRYFDQRLARHVQIKEHLSLMLCDIDCFKLYNDTYGHRAGDVCLQKVAAAIRAASRRNDLVVRYGGEEFAVILPGTNTESATRVANRILHQVRSLKLLHERSLVADYVTLSCGVVTVEVNDELLRREDWSVATLINRADEALYLSKREGRDRVTVVELW